MTTGGPRRSGRVPATAAGLLAAAALVVVGAPLTASADATLNYAIEVRRPAVVSRTSTWWLSDDRVGMKTVGGKSSRVLYDVKDERITIIDDAAKTYLEFTRKDVEALGATMADMSAQLSQAMAGMTPEQKAMIDSQLKTMGASKDGKSGAPLVEVLPMTETKTLQGFQCRKYEVVRGGSKSAEVWAVAAGETTVTPAELAGMNGLIETITKFVDSFATLAGGMGIDFQAPTGIDRSIAAVPVYIKDLEGDAIQCETTLQSLKRGKLDKSVFQLDDDYTKTELEIPGD